MVNKSYVNKKRKNNWLMSQFLSLFVMAAAFVSADHVGATELNSPVEVWRGVHTLRNGREIPCEIRFFEFGFKGDAFFAVAEAGYVSNPGHDFDEKITLFYSEEGDNPALRWVGAPWPNGRNSDSLVVPLPDGLEGFREGGRLVRFNFQWWHVNHAHGINCQRLQKIN